MDRPLRVLYVQPVAETGGSDQTLARMVELLPEGEVQAHVALPGPSPMADRFAAAGASLHVVPMRRITTSGGVGWWVRYALGWPVAVVRLARLVRRVGADVVHSNSLHTWYGWAAALLTGRPHVWHAREIVVQSRLALRLERFLTRRFADVVVCMSEAIARDLPGANRVVVHDDVDRDRFHPSRAGRFRPSVGLPDEAPLAGVVTRIDTWKGVDVALDAFAAAAVPGARMVVVGGDVAGKEPYADGLRRRADEVGADWVGARDDVEHVMADLDVLVAVSTAPEPFGMNVVEALACGCPVVVADHGGQPETAARAEPGSAWVVPPSDVGAAAEALRRALDVRTSTAARRSRGPLLPPAAWDPVALYRSVLAGRCRRRAVRRR